MASQSPYPQFEINLMSNRDVIELILQLKSAKVHGKNYINVKPHLVRHLLRNFLLKHLNFFKICSFISVSEKRSLIPDKLTDTDT